MENHDMNRYDFIEGIEFNGLMPEVMDALGEDKVIGGSDTSVKFMGFEVKGNDQLQVIDIESFYSDEESGAESGESGENNDGNTENP